MRFKAKPRQDELAQVMPEVRAVTKALQELCAELKDLLTKQGEYNAQPCPVCGHMRINGELVEPPPARPGSDEPSLGGHWKVAWVDEERNDWEVIWVDDPKTTSVPPQGWRNPWDSTYTAMREDDA